MYDPSGYFSWLILAAVMLFTPVGGIRTQADVSTLGYMTGWAHKKNIPLISGLAERTKSAEIDVGKWDSRWFVNVGIVILGLLGL